MPVNENDYKQRQEGINIAFSQLEPIIKEKDETIRKLQTEQGEVDVKKVEVKSSTYNLDEIQSPSLVYKFPTIVSEANVIPVVDQFSFSQIFGNMHSDILKAEQPYHNVKNDSTRSSSYKLDVRANAIAEAVSIKMDYLNKAEAEIKRLKSVSVSLPYMTDSEKSINEMTKIANMIYLREILTEATSNVEILEDLYNQNQDNAEIRKILMLHAHKIFRTEKDETVRNKAIKLYYTIKQEDEKFLNKEALKELDSILFHLQYIFNNNERYVTNLDQLNADFKTADGEGLKFRKFFDDIK